MISAIMPSQRKPKLNSDKSSGVRWVSKGDDDMDTTKKHGVVEERRRLREAEKAEKVVHLICWGPN